MRSPAFPNGRCLAALVALGLAVANLSLVTVDGIKDRAVALSLAGQPVRVAALLSGFGWFDAASVLVLVLACLAVLRLELRDRAFGRLLATLTETEAAVLLTLLLALLGHSYWGSGVPLGGDTGTHVSRFLEVSRGLQAGTLAQWTNYQYAGAPLLWFTGPLTYVVGGALAFLLRDAVTATKLLLFSGHVLGGWLFYALLRGFGVRAVAAVVAAAGFAGCFAHLHLFLYRGVVPQALTIVFLVLLFLGADRLMRDAGARAGRRWPGALAMALATAGLILNHQPHALFAAAYLALFGAAALLLGRWRWDRLPVLAGFGTLGALAGLVAVVPVLAEADWVMIEPEGALFGVHLPTARRLLNLVLWRDTRTTWGIDYWAYLGFGPLLLGGAALVGLVRGRLRPGPAPVALAALPCLVLGLFLYNPVVRDVMFLTFFLGILAACGLDWLMASGALTGRWLPAAVALVLLDLVSTAVQPVMRTDKGFMIDAGRHLERSDPAHRIVQLTRGPDGGPAGRSLEADLGPDGGPISYRSMVQRIAGNHNQAATRLHNFLLVTAKLVEGDLEQTGALAPDTRALLAMFNVGRVICNDSTRNGCPDWIEGLDSDAVLGPFLRTGGRPALFSRHLVRIVPEAGVEKPMLWPVDVGPGADPAPREAVERTLRAVVRAERAGAGGVAAAIAVQALPAGFSPQDAVPGWSPMVTDYAVTLTQARLDVETAAPAWVQLAHPWFPSTAVRVNGVRTGVLRGTLDLMVVPVPAGRSSIELRDEATPVRIAAAIASLAGLLAIAAATVWLARRDRAPP